MSGNLTDVALISGATDAMMVPELPKRVAARIIMACYVLRFNTAGARFFMFTININGADQQLDGPPEMPLLWALRDLVGLTGTKFGCGIAQCGACTVQIDGQAIRSCVTPLAAIGSRKVVTIEAIGATPVGKRVQNAWLELQVPQCGYCQSGQVVAATCLIASNPAPSDADIDAAMAGNVCRCGTYNRIRTAIKQAAKEA